MRTVSTTSTLLLLLLPLAVLAVLCRLSTGLVVRTPATSAHFQTFKVAKNSNNENSNSNADNVVQLGGWYALEQTSTAQLAAHNFEKLRPFLPTTTTTTSTTNTGLDVVECGGWYALQQHAADPKGALIAMVVAAAQMAQNGGDTNSASAHQQQQHQQQQQYNLHAITALLHAMGKGFDSDTVDGEWTLLLQQRQGGRQSPSRIQTSSSSSTADFNVAALEFYGRTRLLKYGLLSSTVRYRPTAENFETGSGSSGSRSSSIIILRRIACDIIATSWKFGRLPRLPIPLFRSRSSSRSKGGYLDFIYLDGDIRVTRDNRGGLFVHGRPGFVQSILLPR